MKKLKFNQKNIKKIRRAVAIFITALFILSTCILPAFAADSGTGVEDSFKKAIDLFVGIVKIAGFGLSIWGLVEFGIAWNAHDGAGKLRGFQILAAGLIIFFAKEILSFIGVSI